VVLTTAVRRVLIITITYDGHTYHARCYYLIIDYSLWSALVMMDRRRPGWTREGETVLLVRNWTGGRKNEWTPATPGVSTVRPYRTRLFISHGEDSVSDTREKHNRPTCPSGSDTRSINFPWWYVHVVHDLRRR